MQHCSKSVWKNSEQIQKILGQGDQNYFLDGVCKNVATHAALFAVGRVIPFHSRLVWNVPGCVEYRQCTLVIAHMAAAGQALLACMLSLTARARTASHQNCQSELPV